ncbi:MAG: LysR family transcriptional regulator [Firmicutes bacterium]|nr:LysR family transcriptional regulator [Bacillota bacterium]
MTFRSLQIFTAVARTKSMSEAAKLLCISQPSVSFTVTEIEKEYNIQLFERVNRSLRLTPTGSTLYKYASEIMALHEEMNSFLNNETHSPFVRIGATATVGACVIPPVMAMLKKEHPDLRHNVSVANTRLIEKMLLDGELDIALVEGVIESEDLLEKDAIWDRLGIICSKEHPFSSRSSISLSELAGQELILREEGSGTRAQLLQALDEKKIKANILWSAYNFETIINAVTQGLGISVISGRLVEKELQRKELSFCEISDADFSRSFRLIYHRNRLFTDTMDLFADACLRFGKNELR